MLFIMSKIIGAGFLKMFKRYIVFFVLTFLNFSYGVSEENYQYILDYGSYSGSSLEARKYSIKMAREESFKKVLESITPKSEHEAVYSLLQDLKSSAFEKDMFISKEKIIDKFYAATFRFNFSKKAIDEILYHNGIKYSKFRQLDAYIIPIFKKDKDTQVDFSENSLLAKGFENVNSNANFTYYRVYSIDKSKIFNDEDALDFEKIKKIKIMLGEKPLYVVFFDADSGELSIYNENTRIYNETKNVSQAMQKLFESHKYDYLSERFKLTEQKKATMMKNNKELDLEFFVRSVAYDVAFTLEDEFKQGVIERQYTEKKEFILVIEFFEIENYLKIMSKLRELLPLEKQKFLEILANKVILSVEVANGKDEFMRTLNLSNFYTRDSNGVITIGCKSSVCQW